MVVPSTPLHTTRVLTEDKAMWEDVKVRTTPAPTLTGQTFTALQRYKSLWHMIKYKDCSLEVSIINLKTVFPECCSGRSFKHSSVGLLCFQTRTVTVQGEIMSQWCHRVYKDLLITQICCYSVGLSPLVLLLQVPGEKKWKEFRKEYKYKVFRAQLCWSLNEIGLWMWMNL